MTATATTTLPVRSTLVLRPEDVARWRFARDGVLAAPPAAGEPVPLSYLVFLRAQPALGIDFHQVLDRHPERGLYGGVVYEAGEAPLRVGQVLAVESDVAERRRTASRHGDLVLTTLRTTYRADGVPVATESVRMVDLPEGFVADRPAAPPAPSALPVLATLPGIERRSVAWLTVETGDINALHVDPVLARARGYADVVVPATLINALVERELVAGGGCLQRLALRYHAPTLPGEALTLHAEEEDGAWTLELRHGDTLRAQGDARRAS